MTPRSSSALRFVGASFARDARGSLAVMFVLGFFTLATGLGVALDFGAAYRMRDQIWAAADSATLAAISPGSLGYQAASAQVSDGPVTPAIGVIQAKFGELLANQGLTAQALGASAIKRGRSVEAQLSFKADAPTSFLKIIGVRSIPVSGSTSTLNALPTYIDFHLLLDNSPSMGVAATAADKANLAALSNAPQYAEHNCSFACHDPSEPQWDTYSLARNNGVTLRIDVLREATQKLMDTASTTEILPSQYQVSIETFNLAVQPIAPLSADLAGAKALANAIDMMAIPTVWFNDDETTDFEAALTTEDGEVPANGSGASPNDPQQVVFFVTDGVDDTATANVAQLAANNTPIDPATNTPAPNGTRLLQTMNPALCASLKARGVTVAVIYTTYLPIPGIPLYDNAVSQWVDQINPTLQACATPGYFFEVAPDQGIDEAMKALFLKVVASSRLSS